MEKPESIFALLDAAKKNGVSDEAIYNSVSAFLEQKARATGTPYHGHFELTPLCNLDCKMCYVHLSESQLKDKKLLPSETWINLMQQAIDAGMMSVILSGGECLTYPQFDEVYLFLKSRGMIITVMTNGALLNAKRIAFFRQHPPRAIQISLYGFSEESYKLVTGKCAFETVLKNIQEAKKAKLPLRLMITPSEYMAESIKETIQLAKNLDIPYFINYGLMIPRKGTGREEELHDLPIDDYIEVYRYNNCILNNKKLKPQKIVPQQLGRDTEVVFSGLRCAAGSSEFSIRWDGSMFPCTAMDSIQSDPIHDGFSNAWYYINNRIKSFPSFAKCEDCPFSSACSFCAAENEKRGSRYVLDPYWCERTWKIVENGLRQIESDQGLFVDNSINIVQH